MPRLESFCKDIAGFVALHGDDITQQQREAAMAAAPGAELPPERGIEAVLPQLKRWSTDIRKLRSAETFQDRVREELNQSSSFNGTTSAQGVKAASGGQVNAFDMTDEQLIGCIRQLVETERSVLDSKSAFQAAEAHILEHPDILINRCVTHFRELFGVRSIDGVFPKLNELYVYTNEMDNFVKVLRPTIGMKPNASVHACLAKIQSICSKAESTNALDSIDLPPQSTSPSKSKSRPFKVPQWS
jgi:hypothetical protein